MTKLFYIFAVVSLFAVTAVQADLQCYVCTNCATVNDTQVATCSALNSTTTNTTDSTTNSTDTTTNSTDTTTNSTDTTTNSTDTSSNSTDTTTNSTDTSSNSTDTTTNSTDTSSNSTDTSTNTTDTSSNSTETTTNSTETRRKRSTQDISVNSLGCLCYDGQCDCSRRYAPAVGMTRGQLRASNVSYLCYTHTYSDDNGTEVVDRGCQAIESGDNSTACTLLGYSSGCTECDTDLCNSAFTIKFSITLLVFTIFMLLF